MLDYRTTTTISDDGSITIPGLPFKSGQRVEVIVRKCKGKAGKEDSSRAKSARYTDPFGEAAGGKDWESLGEGSRRGSGSAEF